MNLAVIATFKDILQKEAAVNSSRERNSTRIQGNLTGFKKKVKFVSCLWSIYKSYQFNRVYQLLVN